MTDHPTPEFPPEFLAFLNSITSKRPRTVIQHILEHGYITTEELSELYGYNHPPRAARDVRERGVPLVTFYITNAEGRRIAAYKLGDPSNAEYSKSAGRTQLPKTLKDALIEAQGTTCSLCLGTFEPQMLQIDHRIPYEIIGEIDESRRTIQDYMLLCGSCNRAKSWSCEHCPNWMTGRSPQVCEQCYWANPIQHEHVAMRSIRRLDMVWSDAETLTFDQLREQATRNDTTLQTYVKALLAHFLGSNDSTA